MESEPDYYQILGVEPTADQAALEAAYQGRMLRFRLGQLRDRAQLLPGPSREETEQAYAVLNSPEERARYDADHFPNKTAARRRFSVWSWGAAAAWVAVLVIACALWAHGRLPSVVSPVGHLADTATIATVPSVVVALPPVETPTVVSAPTPQTATPVAVASPPPTPLPIPTPPVASGPSPTAPPAPTATAALTATPAPSFQPTDRIGAAVPVNLRSAPGTDSATLGLLAPGTLLEATGESSSSGGFLWRRFQLADGRIGWVRQADVLPVP